MKDGCPICGGKKIDSVSTFTVDYKTGVVVVRSVPVLKCENCGEEWIIDAVSEQLEKFINTARNMNKLIEVIDYSNYSLVS